MERRAHLTYSEFMQQYVSLTKSQQDSRHTPKHGLWLQRSYPHCLPSVQEGAL